MNPEDKKSSLPFEQQKKLAYEMSQGWFSWIEAVTLTAVLITGALKAQEVLTRLMVGVLATMSFWFVFYSAFFCLCSFFSFQLGVSVVQNRMKKFGIGAIVFSASGIVLGCLVAVLESLLTVTP